MTRETKIGLLVGLAFIIVIGILLSDHLTTSNEPPQASLQTAGANVRSGVTVPGAGTAPPVRMVSPGPMSPDQQVPTRQELTPPPAPPIRMADPTTAAPVVVVPAIPETQFVPYPTPAPVVKNTDTSFGADAPDRAEGHNGLRELATRLGEPVTTVGQAFTGKAYVAQPGDTLNKIAARQMGANNKANREAFLNANPGLKNNPNLIVAGKSYVLPSAAPQIVPQSVIATETTKPADLVKVSGQPEYWYTVKPGDTLWRIASNQLGDPKAIASIKELNRDVLKGENKIVANMKLRLPAKPVASIE